MSYIILNVKFCFWPDKQDFWRWKLWLCVIFICIDSKTTQFDKQWMLNLYLLAVAQQSLCIVCLQCFDWGVPGCAEQDLSGCGAAWEDSGAGCSSAQHVWRGGDGEIYTNILMHFILETEKNNNVKRESFKFSENIYIFGLLSVQAALSLQNMNHLLGTIVYRCYWLDPKCEFCLTNQMLSP